jgi:hypothetical protein
VFASGNLTAQTYFGLSAGGNSSSLLLNEIQLRIRESDIPQKGNLGVQFGISAKHFIQDHAGLQFNLNFVQKGWTEDINEGEFEFTTDLNYLELNTLAHFYIGKKRFKPVILVGPDVSLFLSSNEQDYDPQIEDLITYRIRDDNSNNILFGISGGGGFSLDTEKGDFQFDIRFGIGFSKVIKTVDVDKDPEFSQNRTLYFTLSYFPEFLQIKRHEP